MCDCWCYKDSNAGGEELEYHYGKHDNDEEIIDDSMIDEDMNNENETGFTIEQPNYIRTNKTEKDGKLN